ncbi:DUF4402 domain-containing protein [Massilia sp. Se16.2.3]|uniref:DUF4402 domain-containing protein n=1 Tax=Massilia sp. Se16.2.3 TaxID=2709303 RepID=UPI001AEDAB9B|nr:DUF4402 domain-containing protein [Massilia sp. Se16.2.3]
MPRARIIASTCLAPVLLVAAGGGAFAQQVNLSNTRGLDFGRFAASSGGSVTLGPGGLRSRTGGVVLLNSPSAGQASFAVSKFSNGSGNKSVVITLPANGSTRLASGANSMAVGSFVSSPASIQTIPSSGLTMGVGATLTVAPNQAPGNYSGSFSLIVNYQ